MDSYIRSMHNALKTSGQQKKTSLQLLLKVLLCFANAACISILQLRKMNLHLGTPRIKHACLGNEADLLNGAALFEAICYIPNSANSMTASAVTTTSATDVQL
jgi:hypothetical protein